MDQPSPTPQPPDGTLGLLATAGALYQFFAEYPILGGLDLRPILSTTAVLLGPQADAADAVEVMQQLATALHAPLHTMPFQRPTDGARRVYLSAHAVYDGINFYASTVIAADPYEAFAVDHDPDPQTWTPAECREYASYAAHYPQAVAA
jgi:hypothetical protein